jgi:hypothetical protein
MLVAAIGSNKVIPCRTGCNKVDDTTCRIEPGEPRARREDVLTLSQRERDEFVVVRQVSEGQLTVVEGARRLRLASHVSSGAPSASPRAS